MKFIKKAAVSLLVGAIIGFLTGGLGALVSAPHNWATVKWIIMGIGCGIGIGAFSGIIITTASWLVAKRSVAERIYEEINRTTIIKKTTEGLSRAIYGAAFGSIIGAAIELAIDVNKVLSSPNGMFFYTNDFSPTVLAAPVIGAVVGIGYSFARKPTRKAVSGLIRGIISGMLFGIGVGILWIASTFWTNPFANIDQAFDYVGITIELMLGAVVFGGVIEIVSEAISPTSFLKIVRWRTTLKTKKRDAAWEGKKR